MDRPVGPVLRMCDEVESVISAIRDDNPESDIEVIDRGSYVRVQAPGRVRVTEASLQRHLGPSFELRSLETMLSSFAGRISTTSDEISWEWTTRREGATR
ncbi:MmoB/DmpM family protein [Pseudonocardia acidicola]|uniref:Monooxygenase n=1 Tax=Pseudonocardia acidicola TaxID=2724939 RepID=A0ABX1S9H8_9PSEU|nr:monooxygenase [Pseudonocardia acidicola]